MIADSPRKCAPTACIPTNRSQPPARWAFPQFPCRVAWMVYGIGRPVSTRRARQWGIASRSFVRRRAHGVFGLPFGDVDVLKTVRRIRLAVDQPVKDPPDRRTSRESNAGHQSAYNADGPLFGLFTDFARTPRNGFPNACRFPHEVKPGGRESAFGGLPAAAVAVAGIRCGPLRPLPGSQGANYRPVHVIRNELHGAVDRQEVRSSRREAPEVELMRGGRVVGESRSETAVAVRADRVLRPETQGGEFPRLAAARRMRYEAQSARFIHPRRTAARCPRFT
jgi:hypothetical protein